MVVAGATGHLGGKITNALLKTGEQIAILVRNGSNPAKIQALAEQGAAVHVVDLNNVAAVREACQGATCVVSALSGLRHVIVDTQRALLEGSIQAGVPRFIPSDYSLDFKNLVPGKNRNLDWRMEFHQQVENMPIQITSIFNGAFMDLLAGDMPLILPSMKRVLYWGNATVVMDLTTMDNVAEYTAQAALDSSTPRYLHIAGDRVSADSLATLLQHLTGYQYKTFRAGSIQRLNSLIGLLRFFSKNTKSLYPAWQGMQYMRDMMEGRAVVAKHDNARYPLLWTDVKSFLVQQNLP